MKPERDGPIVSEDMRHNEREPGTMRDISSPWTPGLTSVSAKGNDQGPRPELLGDRVGFRRIRSGVLTLVAVTVLGACGSAGDAETTTVVPTTEAPATTSTVAPTTTTTVYTGPPTLAPGETLPTPIPLPVEDGLRDPEVLLGRISIPVLEVEQPILQGIKLKTFDYGVGHWPGTALPGRVGNVVLGGHRTSGIKPFRYIDKLKKGDEIILSTDEGTFVYLVEHQEVVDGKKGGWIVTQSDSARLTLYACHPPGSTAQRIVVFARYDRKVVE